MHSEPVPGQATKRNLKAQAIYRIPSASWGVLRSERGLAFSYSRAWTAWQAVEFAISGRKEVEDQKMPGAHRHHKALLRPCR